MSKKFYRATIQIDFDYGADAIDWIETMTKTPPEGGTFHYKKLKVLFNKCRICGIDRKFNTLGTGIIGDPADECRSSHAAACQRRVEKNAKSAS